MLTSTMPATALRAGVKTRLLRSGHYFEDSDGTVRSAHFLPHPHSPVNNLDYPPLIAGTVDQIEEGDTVVFVNQADSAFTGLKQAVRVEEPPAPPIYVIDNHFLAYYCWHEALSLAHIGENAILLHIDAHSDSGCPSIMNRRSASLSDVAFYTKHMLSISGFILPAMAEGLISEFWYVHHGPKDPPLSLQSEGVQLQKDDSPFPPKVFKTIEAILSRAASPRQLILDIDLDAFISHPYSRRPPSEEELSAVARFLARLAHQAGVVSIATSPGYAQQTMAVSAAKRVVREIIASA